MARQTRATMEDLMRVPGKAELVNGEIVHMPPAGDSPGRAGDQIFFSLQKHEETSGEGRAVSDNKAFRVDLLHRGSFSRDAAFYTGPRGGMTFFPEPPIFAAEVRSEGDYGPRAEKAMAAKRQDYFDAGTLVVWDVDLLNEPTVRKYTATDPLGPTFFSKGERADAEPAVPGWSMLVDELFPLKPQRNHSFKSGSMHLKQFTIPAVHFLGDDGTEGVQLRRRMHSKTRSTG